MAIEYLGLSEINGPLVVLEGVKNASYEEIVEFHMNDGTQKIGRIVEIYEDKAVIQVFEGTDNMSLSNTHTRLTGHPMEIGLSEEILGRTFNGIGEGFTREDHQDVANQLFSCYAKVGDARALASVIGEDELSPLDKRYLVFGKAFEAEFVGQSETDNRSITETLDKGWELLGLLPKDELDRIDTKILNKYYKETVR